MPTQPETLDAGAETVASLAGQLRRQARRLTGPRQAILRLLASARRPLSSKELHEALPRGFCDVVTVYRSLQLLEKLRAVQRYDLGDGVARYRLLPAGDDGHHHHLVCRACSRVVELDHCILGELEARLARESGYTELTHRLQFFGVCPACRRASAKRDPS